MAELASGAVSSLLGVIRNEAQLLGRVQGDVQFIREEMESMNSFLLHLARTEPPGGHDEQVRTWMNQVRQLAQDCNNCIDLYLFRGNPELHLPKAGPLRCLLWASWFARMLLAQRRAAVRLGELRERARDVGERRVRYGVDVPAKAAAAGQQSPSAGASSSPQGAAVGGSEEDEDEEGGAREALDLSDPSEGFHQDLEDYFNGRLADWIVWITERARAAGAAAKRSGGDADDTAAETPIPSIGVVVENHEDARALAGGARAAAKTAGIRSVFVDLPEVHLLDHPVRAKDILCYMWRELELEEDEAQSQSQKQAAASSDDAQGKGNGQQHTRIWRRDVGKWGIYFDTKEALRQVKDAVRAKVDVKIEEIKAEIIDRMTGDELKLDLNLLTRPRQEVLDNISSKPVGVLLLLLHRSAAEKAARPDLPSLKRTRPSLATWWEEIISITSHKLFSSHMDLRQDCERFLKKLFQPEKEQEDTPIIPTAPTDASTPPPPPSSLSEEQIKAMIAEEVERILEDKFDKKQTSGRTVQILVAGTEEKTEKQTGGQIPPQAEFTETNKTGGQICLRDDIPETIDKLEKIQPEIEALLKIKGVIDHIHHYLKHEKTLVILRVHARCGDEIIRNALSQLGCVAGAVILANSKEHRRSLWGPAMEYSLVGLYHDIVLQLVTRKQISEEEDDKINPQIYRDILDICPNELCMKIFTHALYANPKRSNEELHKLHKTMKLEQAAPKPARRITKKMFKFSYSDLPKEYKTCLLYIAIFPRGHIISRSTLVCRWVVEGLITTEDWSWNNSVQEADECFDELINRTLVCPVDIGATGKVKSCKVGDLIHEFITKIAKKQRIMESRLSRHLARHFSISNDIHLRGSDTVDKFFKKLSESSQLTVLKVLDLEGCRYCFGGKGKRRYLKEICCKILLLKYLSLRGTDVWQLPSEINNLHDLEVLDIRDTNVPESATRHVRLLKLKRLLAGQTYPSLHGSVLIPEKIENMLSMEVLSIVKPRNSQDLKDIGKLWQLRKLGVVIEKDDHLGRLVQAISNLHENLRSLSITLPTSEDTNMDILPISEDTTIKRLQSTMEITTGSLTTSDDISIRSLLPSNICKRMQFTLEVLESLSISGTTKKGKILPLLVSKMGNQLNKVTLSSTWLTQEDLKVLDELSKLEYLKLRDKAYKESQLTFKEGEFKTLKYFLVEGSNRIHIIFDVGATPKLGEMVLPFNGSLELSGVDNLQELEELELGNTSTTGTGTNNNSSLLSSFGNAKNIVKVTLRRTLLKEGDLRILAKTTTKVRCLVLLDGSYDETELTFNESEFPNLNLLIVNCFKITKITFSSGSVPKLNKIIWTYTKMESLSGLNFLPRLRELEFNGGAIPENVKEDIKNHTNRPYRLHNKVEHQSQEERAPSQEYSKGTRFPFFWKNKV